MVVSAGEIMRRVLEVGEVPPLQERGRPLADPLPFVREHEHSRSRWLKRRDCAGCQEAARAYERNRPDQRNRRYRYVNTPEGRRRERASL